ncbi:MAG: DUF123 domain-containing protein [Thermoplasmata archaeon]|nr:GIY-YIG nuclease family protein [Euryarchaeota archaeon]RLF67239.1 MAG: DUF123 domain-containing protein [Thermoplasmata archaeon]
MERGTYILILRVTKSRRVNVGSLGYVTLTPGYYFYVGSGKRGVNHRIRRHFARKKKPHWHIDYVTTASDVYPIGYLYVPLFVEEDLARCLSRNLSFLKGFGCSDSRAPSHMFYSDDLKRGLSAIKEALTTVVRKSLSRGETYAN